MFGGLNPDPSNPAGYKDMWVLSIPSFQWFLVDNGSSTAAPPVYGAMTCYIVGGGSKMLVYGGSGRPSYGCDKTSIHVFDMTKLIWEEIYDPNGGEYQVPSEIYNVIGGSASGGATLLPEAMDNQDMEDTFEEIIKKTKQTNSTRTNTESGVSGGAIAGIVVGVLVGISLISLGILWLRKQSKARARGESLPGSNDNPLAEMPSPLPPGELHSNDFSPPAQELDAHTPSEIASTNNGAHKRVSYYEPVKPELRVRRTDVGGGESIQHSTYYNHGGESIQGQDAGREGR